MGYILIGIACFIVGRKYQELADLMMARRIAKLVEQRNKVADEKEQFDRYVERDQRIGKVLKAKERVVIDD